MKPLQHVWLYVDALVSAGDALSTAVEISRRTGAALTIIGAVGRSEDEIFTTSFGSHVFELVRHDREARLRDVEVSARRSMPSERVRAIMLEGDVPWHSLAAHAAARTPDLLVVAARPGEGPRGFDSVSQHLFRKCSVPVWSVFPGSRPFPRRVLAAVDPGLPGSPARSLARRVLELAVQIRGDAPVEVHVAYAWLLRREEMLRSRLGEDRTRECAEQLRESARRELASLLLEGSLVAAAVHLPKGEPGSAIPALAEELGADVVFLGSAGRTGLPGFFIGSTAESILAGLDRSAVVVKPAEFVSPVRASRSDRVTVVSTHA